MEETVPQAFRQCVRSAFSRVLELTKLQLHEVTAGVFEIPSSHLSVCVRWQVGHGGNAILFTLSPPSKWPATKYARKGEIGLAHAVEFYADGALARSLDIKTQKCGESAHELLNVLTDGALAVEKYCIPALLGLSDDWPAIETFVREKVRNSPLVNKKWSFPPSVRRKWSKD